MPSRPPARPSRAGFAHLLRAEATKFRTVRGWVIAVLVAMLVTVLPALFIGSHSHVPPCTNGPNSPCRYAAIPTDPGGEAVADTFYFVHRPLTADGSILGRLRRDLRMGRTRPGPGRLPATPEGRMRESLRAEWTKLRTLASTGWLLLAAAALTVAVSTASVAAVRCPSGGCADDPAKISLTGIYPGQAVVAVLAVMAVSGEYGTGMICLTLTAMPRRLTVLGAKAAVLTGLVLVTGTIAIFASLLAGGLMLPGHGIGPAHGYPAISPGDGAVLRAAFGSVLYLALIALLSLGAATALREAAVAIGAVLGLLYVLPIIAVFDGNATLSRHLEQIAPMTAGLAIQAITGLSSLPISPWAGLGVLAAWAAGSLVLGGMLLRSRDA
jgi:ABC-2 type transport system permease protein